MAARKKKTTSRKTPRKRAATAAAGSEGSAGAATDTALAEIRERLTRIETRLDEHASAPHPKDDAAPVREALERIERLAQTLAATRAPSPSQPPPRAEPSLDRQMLWAVTVVLVAVLVAFVFLGAHGTVSGDAVTVVLVGFALYVALQARPLMALFGKRREPPAF